MQTHYAFPAVKTEKGVFVAFSLCCGFVNPFSTSFLTTQVLSDVTCTTCKRSGIYRDLKHRVFSWGTA